MSRKGDVLQVVEADTIAVPAVAAGEGLNENIIEVTQDELAYLARNGHQVRFLYDDGAQASSLERPEGEASKQLNLVPEDMTRMLHTEENTTRMLHTEGNTTRMLHTEGNTTTVEVTNATLEVAESVVENTAIEFNESGKKVVEKIDKNDPRSRLHFIKYVKKDDVTIKYWECGICGKEFKHQYTLMRHLPIHTDERNYKCDVCGLSFRQLSTLKQHKMRHSNARPYVCEICQKAFSRVSVLISHKQIHSEKKQHQCPHCDKAFRQKGNLKTHINVHFNAKPWKCEVCGEGFNQKSNLQIHKKTTHSEEVITSSIIINSTEDVVEDMIDAPDQIVIPQEQINLQLNPGQVLLQYPGILLKSEPPPPKAHQQSLRTDQVQRLQPSHPRPKQPKLKSDDVKTYFGNSRGQALLTDNAAIIVSSIETEAMSKAVARGQTPYALLRPARGAPVLVKVLPAPHSKHMLVPANAEDLARAGSVSGEGNNGTVQLKVPVVAIVIQRVRRDGTISITIEPPGNKEETVEEDEEEVEDKYSEGLVETQEIKTQNGDVMGQEGDMMAEAGDVMVQDGDVMVRDGDVVVQDGDVMVEARDVMVQDGDVMVQSGDFSVPEYVIYGGDQSVTRGRVDISQQNQNIIYVDQGHQIPGSRLQQIVVGKEGNQQILVEGEMNQQIIVEGQLNHHMIVDNDSTQTLYLQDNLPNAVIIDDKSVAYLQRGGEHCEGDQVVEYLQHTSYQLVQEAPIHQL